MKIINKKNDKFTKINPKINFQIKKNDKNKENLLWSISPFNKKINTYENIFNKKSLDSYVAIRDKLVDNQNNHTT